MRESWVYILINRPNGTLYVGVTADLARRMEEHRQDIIDGFTKRYERAKGARLRRATRYDRGGDRS